MPEETKREQKTQKEGRSSVPFIFQNAERERTKKNKKKKKERELTHDGAEVWGGFGEQGKREGMRPRERSSTVHSTRESYFWALAIPRVIHLVRVRLSIVFWRTTMRV